MKVITLFAGGGGSSLGFLHAGWDSVYAQEVDRKIAESYRLNIGEIDVRDFRTTDWDNLPASDCWNASPPCQSFSTAGRGGGVDDDRGSLFVELIDAVVAHTPPSFIIENVPGIVSKKHVADFNIQVEKLEAAGYHTAWKILNSVDFGVPQRRKRVFLVGFLDIKHFEKFEFPVGEGCSRRLRDVLEDTDECGVSAEHIKTLENDPRWSNKIKYLDKDAYGTTLISAYAKNPSQGPYLQQIGHIGKNNSKSNRVCSDECAVTQCGTAGGLGAKTGLYLIRPTAAVRGRPVAVWDDYGMAGTVLATQGKSADWGPYVGNLRRLSANGPYPGDKTYSDEGVSATVLSHGDTQTPHYECHGSVRRLTPRECARLQGFPDTYVLPKAKTLAYKILGNAVTVSVALALAKAIMKAMDGS